ncbi:MAG TPA: sporulation protein [Lentzea sp.]
MFKRMLSAFGIGGPTVDTVLDSPHALPGLLISGRVNVRGGGADTSIDQVLLSLVTQVEAPHDDVPELLRMIVRRDVRVSAGELVSIPFQLRMPWETPITAVGGTLLPGITVGLLAGGDLVPVLVGPLPSQDRVLDAFGQLGFTFRGTTVEAGLLHGVPHDLGCYQELAFFPPASFARRVYQVGLTFVTSPEELRVILEAGNRDNTYSSRGDTSGCFRVSHEEALTVDWVAAISGWLSSIS